MRDGTEQLLERAVVLLQCRMKCRHFIFAERERGRCVQERLLRVDGSTLFLVLLGEIHMQYDERRTTLALQLQKHEIVTRQLHRRKVDTDVRAALRASHLLSNASEDLMQRVGIQFHRIQYSRI